ncbi:MAG: DUF512 domain-containing protein [Lachnospiraceae bacterium]|nr:DUF512 domain-containing protein [Lachnospiraceae bacterium]
METNLRAIREITEESPFKGTEVSCGDSLVMINGEQIEDIFDYQYLTLDEKLECVFERPDGSRYTVSIDKDSDEDPGLVFDDGLMDGYRSCTNKCVFCFIDQMPPGMRETLYFKDDDSRLSFLQGNYVTLTNMSDHDVDRICKYHLSPINISFHTTNPELRCMMLHNRFAGESLKKVDRLKEAGIVMNGQIVLCKGLNDGAELERSISDLTRYMPELQSISVVPVGLTRFRDGLYPLQPFEPDDALKVLEIIHSWQDRIYEKTGIHFVHASDEWYILAGLPLPEEDRYDGYVQLENGVGMVRLMLNEFDDAYRSLRFIIKPHEELSIVTGKLMYPIISGMTEKLMSRYPKLNIHVYAIRNDFFGEKITVSGLITGQDMIAQLKDKPLGKRVLIPENTLRAGEDYFLDDITVTQLADALQSRVEIVKSSGYDFVDSITGSGLRLGKKRRN